MPERYWLLVAFLLLALVVLQAFRMLRAKQGAAAQDTALSSGDPSGCREYEQTLLSLRHYSTLRYAVLTVFIAINGALMAAIHGKDAFAGEGALRSTIEGLGLLTALSFGFIELTLDGYLTSFSAAAERFKGSHWNDRPRRYARFVSVATLTPHVALLVFWCWALLAPAPPARPKALDAAQATAFALAELPKLSRIEGGDWRVDASSWLEAGPLLDLVVSETRTGDRWSLAVDPQGGGRLLRAGKLPASPPPRPPVGELAFAGTAGVQARLLALGYRVGPADGIAGPRTIGAWQCFQRHNGLPPSCWPPRADSLKRLFQPDASGGACELPPRGRLRC